MIKFDELLEQRFMSHMRHIVRLFIPPRLVRLMAHVSNGCKFLIINIFFSFRVKIAAFIFFP